MLDIKFRNVKIEDAWHASNVTRSFMSNYADRRGIRHGVAYGSNMHQATFYVYRTDKTVVCVGQYEGDGE
jgi:hypothetical protein